VFGAPRPPATPAAPGAAPAAPGMPGPSPEWEQQRAATLDNPALKKGLKLVWFATGSEDFLLKTTQQTVEMLKKRNFDVVYKETDGGHTWIKWRDYLNEFAPKLF
jgi:enterochelin esterase family protein